MAFVEVECLEALANFSQIKIVESNSKPHESPDMAIIGV